MKTFYYDVKKGEISDRQLNEKWNAVNEILDDMFCAQNDLSSKKITNKDNI